MPITSIPREQLKLFRGPGDRLVLLLEPIPDFKERGYYKKDDEGRGKVPDRYLALDIDAADSLRRMEEDYPSVFYFSDIFRNATGSRGRRVKNREKRIKKGESSIFTGKIPGDSAHSYGFCTDDDVGPNLERLRDFLEDPSVNKEDYDAIKREYGWYCHRDGPRGDHNYPDYEHWHFNFLGDDPVRWLNHCGRKTSGGVEAKVRYKYGPFALDGDGVSAHLVQLGYSLGDAGVRQFQEDWTLDIDGVTGPVTQRVLLYVGAEVRNARTGQPLADPLTFP